MQIDSLFFQHPIFHLVFLFFVISGTVSEHTMLLEGVCSRPAPTGNSAPVSGVEIMRKLSKSHTHNETGLRIRVCTSVWEFVLIK